MTNPSGIAKVGPFLMNTRNPPRLAILLSYAVPAAASARNRRSPRWGGKFTAGLAFAIAAGFAADGASAQTLAQASDWTVMIANDTCPDYTWGNTEAQTRRNFADLVGSHLDEMKRTDGEPTANRDHYNMAVTQEALCLVEYYPERKAELIRRINEGRVLVSPFLCNTLWGFQSLEGALRSFYPARRLEREWGIPIDLGHHIEHPALPWGVPTILAGCGIRWVNLPFLDYDCTFGQLRNPPLFIHEGPDGSRVRVVLDAFASRKASYSQGAYLLKDPKGITNEWLPHYESLGAAYPARMLLASGTHNDTYASSAGQTRGFAEAIIRYNAGPQPRPQLVNGTLARFFRAIDEVEARKPFLQTWRGCFGHSWDLWPVSLAREAADARQNDRDYLATEALVALACRTQPSLRAATRANRERAEWCWAMLADHAWNGTDDANRQENARLRRAWNTELARLTKQLADQAWVALGLAPGAEDLTVFNSLSVPHNGLVRVLVGGNVGRVREGKRTVPSQIVEEEGERALYFVARNLDGFGFRHFQLARQGQGLGSGAKLRVTPTELESPFYSLRVDAKTGGLSSLVHKTSGKELIAGVKGRTLGQTVYWDGREHTLTNTATEVVAAGPVLARLRVTGAMTGIGVTSFITLYADLDRADFDCRIHKPSTTNEQRLCQIFPVLRDGAQVRIETPAAVIRPEPQPQGDLLPGADPRRFAVQGFVAVSSPGAPGVTIAPLDAFALRMDLDPIAIEALGNDQNYKEVSRNQGGVTEFRFRYALRAHVGDYDNAEAVAWSRAAASPPLVALGRLRPNRSTTPAVTLNSRRAIATCLKPADEMDNGGTVLRVWEVGGESGPLAVEVRGCSRAIRTDLLERDLEELPIRNGRISLDLRAKGLAGLRLFP